MPTGKSLAHAAAAAELPAADPMSWRRAPRSPSFKISRREPECGSTFFKIIAEQRRADEIVGQVLVRGLSRLPQRLRPAIGIIVATAEPHQRQHFLTFRRAQPVDCVPQLL